MPAFVPENLSPAATAHLAFIRAMLFEAIELGTPPPAHHVGVDTAAYTTALAWASAVSREMLASERTAADPTSPHDRYPLLMASSPLALEEFALYVGLLFEAFVAVTHDPEHFAAAVESLMDSEIFPYGPTPGAAINPDDRTPPAVLLAMYLRMWSTIRVAAIEHGEDRVAEVSEVVLGVVLTLLHPVLPVERSGY